jgi:plasmid stabilization system protein ParE
MSYRVRYTKGARDDIRRLYSFLLDKDIEAARRALDVIRKGVGFLRDFPFSCRTVAPNNPFLREFVIPFGSVGYVALFEIDDQSQVTIRAVRHQREDDYR